MLNGRTNLPENEAKAGRFSLTAVFLMGRTGVYRGDIVLDW